MRTLHKTGVYSVLTAFWLVERVVGLAGIPDDWDTWTDLVVMVPDPIGWLALGAFSALTLNQLWEIIKNRRARRNTNESEPIALSYLNAGALIDRYISPATVVMPASIQLTVRKDLLDRFGETPGAKLGEYEYNGVLLRQWLEHNAARFLVQHRGDLQ